MFSFLNTCSVPSSARKRSRRLRPEQLENRRVLAGAIDVCLPLAEGDLPDVPSEESTVPPFGPEIRRDSPDQKARPFRITGGDLAANGLPLVQGVTNTFSSAGNATGLGKYEGDGTFTLGSLEISEAGEVSGTFEGTFVFIAANGDQLAVTFGDGFSGVFTGQRSGDEVENVEFDAFFRPDPENSTGRFERVVSGGWRMIAKSDSVSLVGGTPGFTAPFDYTWSGAGTLEYAKKAK